MKILAISGAFAMLLAAPAFAESHGLDLTATGDAEKGEKAFRKCQSCHVVKNDEGETLAGRNGRVGPNLYGLVGRTAGKVEDFRYGKDLVAAGEAGLVFDEEAFVSYVMDPRGVLREVLDDGGARSKMSYRVRKEDEAKDLYAFLKSLQPETAEMEDSGS